MKRVGLLSALRALAVGAVPLVLMPPLCLLYGVLGPAGPAPARVLLLYLGLLGGLGAYYLGRRLAAGLGWPAGRCHACGRAAGLLLALGGGAACLALPGPAPLRAGFALLAAVAALLGLWCARRPYALILNRRLFLLDLGESLAAVFLLWLQRRQWPGSGGGTGAVTLSFLLLAGVYALVCNQSGIDDMMMRRRHPLELLPPAIRRYNLLCTLALSAAVLGCFLLRRQVAALLRLVFRAMGALVLLAGRAVLWLFSLFEFVPGLRDTGRGVEPPSPPPSPGRAGGEGVILLLALICLGAVLYRQRRHIAASLRQALQRLAALLRRLLFAASPQLRAPQGNAYYADRVQALAPGTAASSPSRFQARRAGKRGYRAFLRMPPGGEKYRLGFRLLLSWLRPRAQALRGCDTPGEILQKAAPLLPGEELPRVVEGYSRVRYGGLAPSEGEMESLCALLGRLAQTGAGK